MTRRYTITQLRADVDRFNGYLLDEGIDTRLQVGGRNGYQAVDEYSVDANGDRTGSHVNCNVCCGTSRECGDAVAAYYNAVYNRKRIADLQARIEELEDCNDDTV